MKVKLLSGCLILIHKMFSCFTHRFEENSAENNIPFTETNVPLQPLSLPKAEVFMTVGNEPHMLQLLF